MNELAEGGRSPGLEIHGAKCKLFLTGRADAIFSRGAIDPNACDLSSMIEIPSEYAPYLRMGTCSWKYESWRGLYYDEGRTYRADEYLHDYARHLNTVEVDQWFWSLFPGGLRMPAPRVVQQYADSVPDDFVFTVKAPNAITLTHFYAKQPDHQVEFAGRPNIYFLDNEILERFLDALAPLGKKLGPIMFQFEYLNRRKMSSRAKFQDAMAEFITKAPKEFEYGLEIRNPDYLTDDFFDFLTSRRIGFVYLDGYQMPSVGEVYDRFKPATTDWTVMRLHGPDRYDMEQRTRKIWNKVVVPRDERLREVAAIIRANSDRQMRTFVNVNNHYEGSAPATIERLLGVLREQVRDA